MSDDGEPAKPAEENGAANESTGSGSDAGSGLRESRADRLRRRRGAQRERVDDGSGAGSDAGTGKPEEAEEADELGGSDASVEAEEVGGTDGPGGADAAGGAGTTEEAAGAGGAETVVGDDEAEEAAGRSVKEEQVGTYMYLPRSQKREVEHRYTVLKAEFEYAFDRDFEKNRHFFPLLVEHGLSGLDDSDADDVREMLQSLDR